MRLARPLVVATLLAVAVAPAAHAGHRRIAGSAVLRLPVPYPLEDSAGSHCADAPDGQSKFQKTLTLPKSGKLRVDLSGYTGDWVLELFDAKKTLLSSAASLSTSTAGGVTVTWKKKSNAKQPITIMACNYTGGPDGRLAWSFVYH